MIVYFSGTGNTRLCARELASRLGDELVELGKEALLDASTVRLTPAGGRVVWMFPVYSWDIPRRIAEIMRHAEIPAGCEHWMVCTCGDDIGHTHRC